MTLLPLVEVQFVANAHNEWVALHLHIDASDPEPALQWLFGSPDLLAAVAPLDCVLQLASVAPLTPSVLKLLPPNRVILAIDAGALADSGAARQLDALHEHGYRVLLDGAPPVDAPRPAHSAVSLDCSGSA
ncbi:hypothetical protein E4O92_11480, partial [Massilia horti]